MWAEQMMGCASFTMWFCSEVTELSGVECNPAVLILVRLQKLKGLRFPFTPSYKILPSLSHVHEMCVEDSLLLSVLYKFLIGISKTMGHIFGNAVYLPLLSQWPQIWSLILVKAGCSERRQAQRMFTTERCSVKEMLYCSNWKQVMAVT